MDYDQIMALVGNNGGTFDSFDDVYDYFKVPNIVAMFGSCDYSQDDLTLAARYVWTGRDDKYAHLFSEIAFYVEREWV
jgi:hypothetical protein